MSQFTKAYDIKGVRAVLNVEKALKSGYFRKFIAEYGPGLRKVT
jgi:hypothetical protein